MNQQTWIVLLVAFIAFENGLQLFILNDFRLRLTRLESLQMKGGG